MYFLLFHGHLLSLFWGSSMCFCVGYVATLRFRLPAWFLFSFLFSFSYCSSLNDLAHSPDFNTLRMKVTPSVPPSALPLVPDVAFSPAAFLLALLCCLTVISDFPGPRVLGPQCPSRTFKYVVLIPPFSPQPSAFPAWVSFLSTHFSDQTPESHSDSSCFLTLHSSISVACWFGLQNVWEPTFPPSF